MYGASWSDRGVIVFPNSATSGLYRVPATGGTPVPATTLDDAAGEISHRLAWFLPHGRHFLFSVRHQAQQNESAVYVGDIDSKERTLVMQKASHAAYMPAGEFLLYTMFGINNSPLMAQRFDVSTLRTVSAPFPVADSVNLSINVWAQHQFSVSRDGTLVYASSSSPVRLTWLDRTGKVLGHVGVPDAARRGGAISPDGTMVAAESHQSGSLDIWLHDLVRGASSRFTFNPSSSSAFAPAWAPDGKSLLFAGFDKTNHLTVMRKSFASDGVAKNVGLPWGDPPRPVSGIRLSPDGRYVVARLNPGVQTGSDIWMMPLSPADQKPRPLLQSNANEGKPLFQSNIAAASNFVGFDVSKDGRFLIPEHDELSAVPLTLLVNWQARVKK
jgi:WD40 repeat protein